MTCIAGYIDSNKRVHIGGDSAGVAGNSLSTRKDRKVFHVGRAVIGFTTSFRMGQLLQYGFRLPPNRRKDIFEWMVRDVIKAIRKRFASGGFAKKTDNVEMGGTFLMGVDSRLFYVGDDFQVGETTDKFDAIGCGESYAKGAFAAIESRGPFIPTLTPQERVRIALGAAARFSTSVTGPFYVVATPQK